MKYYGSKRRLADYIFPIILKDRKSLDQYYVEPFCGGCNLIDKVNGKRMASDINRPLIALLKGIVNGWTPPEAVSKEEYYAYKALYKDGKMLDEPIMGWVGFCCSFCGRFMEGYAADFCDTDKKKRYQEDAKKNLAKQAPNLKGIEFYSGSYDELPIPANSIIYCDPPYQGFDRYRTKMDYDKFWQWCRDKVAEGHQVFVSEYKAPDDFECVFSMESVNTISVVKKGNQSTKKTHTSLEKLFTFLG